MHRDAAGVVSYMLTALTVAIVLGDSAGIVEVRGRIPAGDSG